MKVIWLGQAGLLMELNGCKIIIDPYLSDSVAQKIPTQKRRVPVDNSFLSLKPDIIILTHDHPDHTDPQTLEHYLTQESKILVLASRNAWSQARAFKGSNNYVMFNRHTVWTQNGITFTAVRAQHSDPCAIGVVIQAEGKCFYVTGDTLYNTEIFEDLPSCIDYVFLPVNGYGNNMNMEQAAQLCGHVGATAIPMHCGLFDDINMQDFAYPNKVIPEFFKEIKLCGKKKGNEGGEK